jgi:hypothetical protein
MAKTVDEAFDQLHARLTPTGSETEAAKRHRASIQECLADKIGLDAFFRSGSFGNGTSVSGYSDVDYFAEVPRMRVPLSSSEFLARVHRALDARFPYTGVTIDAPAIVLPFGSAREETTEVVPAELLERTWQGHRIYQIANGKGGWTRASPDAHGSYVDEVNDALSKKVKPLIRFVKVWKYYHSVPVSSFYLEMFAAQYAHSEKAIIYAMDVRNVLQRLRATEFADLQDPKGISGSIEAAGSFNDRWAAAARVSEAATWAERARAAEHAGKLSDAFAWWDKVFNGKFPGYW